MAPNCTSKRPHFPDLPPPPPPTGGFTLRLPPTDHTSHLRCAAEPVPDEEVDQGDLGPFFRGGSGLDPEHEGVGGKEGPAHRRAPLREKTGLKSEGVWRRHLSLEDNPLLLLSSSPDETPSDWGGGKSLSVRNLSRPLSNHASAPPAALSHAGAGRGDLSDWEGTELFIRKCELESEGEHFNFLSQGPDRGPSDLLHPAGESAPPPKGNGDFLPQTPHIQLA